MATFPPGVTLATITAGSTTDFFGNEATVSVDVTPVLAGNAVHLVHAATGTTLVIATRRFTSGLGEAVTFQVPHVNQPGWIDSTGQSVTHWSYRVEVTAQFDAGTRHRWAKTVQPLVGQNTVDLDLVADGAVYDPRFSPVPHVLSVNGQTGVISVGELVGPRGPAGATGPANTLNIGTVTTGAAGANAAATITGASPNQTLNLTLPRGATGAAGPAGTNGGVGPQGEPGPAGPAGQAANLQMGTVATGAAGTNAGATITGTAPNQVLNLTLPRGTTGATGPAGPAGPAGGTGPRGSVWYMAGVSGATTHTAVSSPASGDSFLYPATGAVWRYSGTSWVSGGTLAGTATGGGESPTLANIPAGSTITVSKVGLSWPSRPTDRSDVVVQWKGPEPSPAIVTFGTGGMRDNVDLRLVTS